MVSYTECYLLLVTIIAPASTVSRAVLGGTHYPHSAGEESEGVKAIQSLQGCALWGTEESSDNSFVEVASGG